VDDAERVVNRRTLYKQANERSLAEIVYDAGFGSYGQFYKIFVQTYGHGPRVTTTTSSSSFAVIPQT
jgi:methylphosphotriester-DNA--protein-cysteine methyltransferase